MNRFLSIITALIILLLVVQTCHALVKWDEQQYNDNQ